MVLPLACSRDRRALTTQPSSVGARGCWAGVRVDPGVPHRGAGCRPERVVIGVKHVHVGFVGKFGSSAMPSSPRSQKLYTLTFKSAKTVGVGSVRESKTLITPRFSATNIRPSLREPRPPSDWSAR